jgi:trimethylamine-N-oxide reductase (cytochrome c)
MSTQKKSKTGFNELNGRKLTRRKFISKTGTVSFVTMAAPSFMGRSQAEAASREVLTGAHWGVMKAKVEGGRFVEAIPFAKDPLPTSLVEYTPDMVYSQSRIRHPMVRAGFLKEGPKSNSGKRGRDAFVQVSWDKALELVASELKRVRATSGPSAIYAGNPGWKSPGKLHSSSAALARLLNLNGGYTPAMGDYSTGAGQVIMSHVMGNMEVYSQQTAWPVVLKESDLIVMWGSDPMTTLKMDWVLPDHYGYAGLKKLKESGKKVISIDPFLSDSAQYLRADWIAPRPNTDTAILLAVAYTLEKEKLHDEKFLKGYTVGFDRFSEYLKGAEDGQEKTPEWAASISGLSAERIRELARQMSSRRTMIMGGWSIQRADHGEQPYWALVTVAAMLGQIGLPGGGFGFSYHYASGGAPSCNSAVPGGFSGGKSPDNMPEGIPVARISDALLHPGESIDFNGHQVTFPDIKLVYWAGGNPFHHQQDRNKMIRAWDKPETVIIQDQFWTASAKFADIVLPISTSFERNDLEMGGDYSTRFLFPMHKVIDPLYESKSDFEVCAAIADRLGYKNQFTEGKNEMDWLRTFYDAAFKQAGAKGIDIPSFSKFWESGVYVEFKKQKNSDAWVRHADFREDPLLEPLGTPSGLIEIYSKTIAKMGYQDCAGHAKWYEPAEWLGSSKSESYPLHLLSPHPADRLHSQANHSKLREK